MNTKLFEVVCKFIDDYGFHILVAIPVVLLFWALLVIYGLLFGG